MPKNWKTYNLGELVDLKQGLAINKKTKHLLTEDTSEMPLFKINDLINNTVKHYVKSDEVPKQCIAKEDELIYTRTGQVGLIFKGKQGCIHNNCFKIIPDETLISKEYIYWFLRQPNIVEYANNIASGSVQKDLNHAAFKSIEIILPDTLKEQKAIANILSAIDDKIENNLAINNTLEDMAMALYKHWFVDFGPFQDGEFIDSELGPIPKGWEVKRLPEISINHNKKRKPISTRERAKIQGKYPYYGATKILDYINDYRFDGEFILLAEDGTVKTDKDTPFLQFVNGQFWVSNHAHVLTGNENFSNEFLYLSLSNTNVIPIITGAVQLKINKQNLESLEFIVPTKLKLTEFEDIIIPFYKEIKKLETENQTLTKLRDTILPKLISGEERLKEFQKKVEKVL